MADILIIDDEPRMRHLVAHVLRRAGHTVREAENGKLGLKLFQQQQPALVICDIVMPDGEGIETIQQMRLEAPTMPILAISGGSSQALYLRMAAGLGATASLEKPFDHEQLTAAVETLLRGHSDRPGPVSG
jgi:DNA-binding response OmpR family regulator